MSKPSPNRNIFAGETENERRNTEETIDELVGLLDELVAVEEAVTDLKDDLRFWAKDRYWDENESPNTPLHTFDALGSAAAVQLNFVNKYELDQAKLLKIKQLLGEKAEVLNYLKQKTLVTVDVTSLSKERMLEFFQAALALTKEYGIQGVVDDAYIVEPEFHDARHRLTREQNQAIDEIMPMQVHITP